MNKRDECGSINVLAAECPLSAAPEIRVVVKSWPTGRPCPSMAELSLGLLLLLAIIVVVQGNPKPVFCPKGVSRFSATDLPNHYYSCE